VLPLTIFVLLNQTTEVQVLPNTHNTQFPTFVLSCVRRSVREEALFRARIIPLVILDVK